MVTPGNDAEQIAGHESPPRLSVSGVAGGIEVVVSAVVMVSGDRSAHALSGLIPLAISRQKIVEDLYCITQADGIYFDHRRAIKPASKKEKI